MMVHAFRKGIVSGPSSESLIRNRPKTFTEIRRRAVAHIAAEGEVNEKRTCVVPMRPRTLGLLEYMALNERGVNCLNGAFETFSARTKSFV